ncbi:MAG: type II toxin-antitoxin system HicA family toxin [Candidatus Andersenbacteria bacterium]|nr:type II toxin-antitoxin system HicA family toxin [Candidatus Andersenbacteria bacterium]
MRSRLPSLTPRQVVGILRRANFYFHHQRGSHAYYRHHTDLSRWVTVPMHARQLKKGTLRSIIRQSGLGRELFYGANK